MNINLIKALMAKYKAEELQARANLEIYMSNAVGIGEHRDIVAECDALVQQITDAMEKQDTVRILSKDFGYDL